MSIALPSGSTPVPTRGWVFVHSCRRAFFPHVESVLAEVLGSSHQLQWTTQPAIPNTWRTDVAWRGAASTSARLLHRLRMFPNIYVEVTEEPTPLTDGIRYALVPDLGLWSGAMNAHGDVVLNEEQVRSALRLNERDMQAQLRALLGQPWDEVLEPLRSSSDRVNTPLLRVM